MRVLFKSRAHGQTRMRVHESLNKRAKLSSALIGILTDMFKVDESARKSLRVHDI